MYSIHLKRATKPDCIITLNGKRSMHIDLSLQNENISHQYRTSEDGRNQIDTHYIMVRLYGYFNKIAVCTVYFLFS